MADKDSQLGATRRQMLIPNCLRASQLAFVAITQELESLRNDPRFREMLLSMGFPLSGPETSSLANG
jgi:hypothetical protein